MIAVAAPTLWFTGPELQAWLGAYFAHQWPSVVVWFLVGVLVTLAGRHLAVSVIGSRRGFATVFEIARTMSRRAVRQSVLRTRPSLTGQALQEAPVAAYGLYLGRARHTRQRLYSSLEDVVGFVAPPRMGKTATLTPTIIEAPGAVLATSTRVDIYEHTARPRAAVGAIAVFNPEGLGELASTFRWSPITGCTDPATAMRRAGYLLSGSPATKGTEDREFWNGQSYRVLRAYLFAAAVAEKDMRGLLAWVTNPQEREPLEVLKNPRTPVGWRAELEQVSQAPEKTRDSVYLTLALTFSWMGDPQVAQAALPGPEETVFDPEAFIQSRGTLYLLGADRGHGGIAPLFSCLTGEVYEAARQLGSRQPGGRLDPPLLPVLDEAYAICPVPLVVLR